MLRSEDLCFSETAYICQVRILFANIKKKNLLTYILMHIRNCFFFTFFFFSQEMFLQSKLNYKCVQHFYDKYQT